MDYTQTINDIDADPIPDIKADTVEIVNIEPQDTLNYDSHEDDDPFDVDSDEDNQLEKIQYHNNESAPTKKQAIDGAEDLQKIPCTYCDSHFSTQGNCNRHIRECHADKLVSNQCPYCTLKPIIYSLTAHIYKHHKDKPEIQWFRCYQCKFKAKSKQQLKRHITYKHTDPNEIIDQMNKCKKCPKMFKCKYDLNRHILQIHKKHNAKKLKCSQCDYKCISSHHLQNHCDVLHSDFEKLDTLQCLEDDDPFDVGSDKDNQQSDPVQLEKIQNHNNKSAPTKKQAIDGTGDLQKIPCTYCDSHFSTQGNCNRHIRECHAGKPRDKEKIQNHNNKSAPTKKQAIDGTGDLQKIPCTYCDSHFSTQGNCNRHIRECHVGKPRDKLISKQCPYCTLKRIYSLRAHIIRHHKDKIEIPCTYCDVHFTTRSSCTRHIRECHADKLIPNQCPYCTFKSLYSLTDHIIRHHKDKSEIQWFRCNGCKFKAKSKQGLKKHITHKHTDPNEMIDQMNKCKKCPKMFKVKSDLNKHILQVHEKHNAKKLKCSQCDYECIFFHRLQQHCDVVHADFEKLDTLQCPECSYKTKFRINLNSHIKKCHGDQKYQCEKCPYRTNTPERIKLHLIKHKEVKDEADLKYRCDKCAYKTYRHYSLQIHKLNHLTPKETRYFFCYHCNFKAKRKDNLKTHVLRHFKRDEITLACYICEFTTVKRHLLARHIDKHSKEMSKTKKLVSVKTESVKYHLV